MGLADFCDKVSQLARSNTSGLSIKIFWRTSSCLFLSFSVCIVDYFCLRIVSGTCPVEILFFSDRFFQFVGTIQILILFPHLLEVSHSLTLSANIWAYIVIHHLGCTCRESDGLHDIAQFWPEASSSYSLCIAIQPAFTHFQVLPGLFFSSLLMRILCRTTVCSIWGKRMYIL